MLKANYDVLVIVSFSLTYQLFTGAHFSGEIPQQAKDAAAALNRPSNKAAMRLPEKPIYKVGTARTTKSFHHTVTEARVNFNTNNNNAEDVNKNTHDMGSQLHMDTSEPYQGNKYFDALLLFKLSMLAPWHHMLSSTIFYRSCWILEQQSYRTLSLIKASNT